MSIISRCKQSPNILCQLLKTRDLNKLTSLSFTIVHELEQGQVAIVLFRKLDDGELSDKVLSTIKRVTWQLLSKCLCSLSVRVTLYGVKALNLALQRLVSYHFTHMSLHAGCLPWQKLTQKIIILTRACRLTVAGLLFCGPWGKRQESYLPVPRLYKERGQNLNINVSIIIRVNFDHAWVKHYPVTLRLWVTVCI